MLEARTLSSPLGSAGFASERQTELSEPGALMTEGVPDLTDQDGAKVKV